MMKQRVAETAARLVLGLVTASAIAEPVEPTAATPEAEGWRQTVVAGGLEHPWAIAFLPVGDPSGVDALITERPGRVRKLVGGRLDRARVPGIEGVLSHGQGGLMDVSLHPGFAENRLVYFTMSVGTPRENNTRLIRARFDGRRLLDVETVFDAQNTKRGGFHFGSRIAWLADGTLLVTTGDGGFYRPEVQDLSAHFGKVFRLTDEGEAPTDNPFVGRTDADPRVYSYGHRNPQGLVVDPRGRIWETEHGALGGDELNLIEPGKNYGWPEATFSREYSGKEITPNRTLPGVTDALVVWTPCIAPSGLAYYDGEAFPAWRGDLFAGGLVLEQVRRVDLDDAGRVQKVETLSIGSRVRDVRQGPDGYLYVLTDEDRGQLLRIEPDDG